MLINGNTYISMAKLFRVIYIAGRYGGGKTALAFRTAEELLEKGFCKYLVSNVPNVWQSQVDNIESDEFGCLNTVIILDEGGLFLEDRQSAKEFMVALRKLNVVILIPSVWPPSSKLKMVRTQRTLNGQVFGLNAWAIECSLNYLSQKEKFTFYWQNPSEIFGVYDTRALPIDDAGIGGWLYERIERIKTHDGKITGRKARQGFSLSGGADTISKMESGRGLDAGQIDDLQETLEETESFISLLNRRRSGRR